MEHPCLYLMKCPHAEPFFIKRKRIVGCLVCMWAGLISAGVFVCFLVFAEELEAGEGGFRAGLQNLLLDGSLQEVCSVLSKALYGEPLVNQLTFHFHNSLIYCTQVFPEHTMMCTSDFIMLLCCL